MLDTHQVAWSIAGQRPVSALPSAPQGGVQSRRLFPLCQVVVSNRLRLRSFPVFIILLCKELGHPRRAMSDRSLPIAHIATNVLRTVAGSADHSGGSALSEVLRFFLFVSALRWGARQACTLTSRTYEATKEPLIHVAAALERTDNTAAVAHGTPPALMRTELSDSIARGWKR